MCVINERGSNIDQLMVINGQYGNLYEVNLKKGSHKFLKLARNTDFDLSSSNSRWGLKCNRNSFFMSNTFTYSFKSMKQNKEYDNRKLLDFNFGPIDVIHVKRSSPTMVFGASSVDYTNNPPVN